MSDTQPTCPQCQSVHAYQDRSLWICPECFHEWDPTSGFEASELGDTVGEGLKFLDANGEQLQNGDTVATVKELKVGKDTFFKKASTFE
jgi:protein PhnA